MKPDYKKMFELFLEEEGIAKEFSKYFKQGEKYFERVNPLQYVTMAFHHGQAPQPKDEKKWHSLDMKWRVKYKICI